MDIAASDPAVDAFAAADFASDNSVLVTLPAPAAIPEIRLDKALKID
jgi:hypothetical protein